MTNGKQEKSEPKVRTVKVSEEAHRRLKVGAAALDLTIEQALDRAVESVWPEWQKRAAKA